MDLHRILEAFDLPQRGATFTRASSGLIQLTFFADVGGQRVVMQRMHPVFAPAVLEDIDAVTAHLAAAGLATPRPLRARSGAFTWADDEGHHWRVLTYLDGETVDRVDSPARAREAGRLVARFHGAVAGFAHEFRFTRAGVHDTAAHLGKLAAVSAATGELARLADEILDEARALPALGALPRRITHGDLKISNVLFAGGAAVALIDLDTLGRLPLAHELGDAWRSWCNPLGEDVEDTRFDEDVFAAAVDGYASGARGLLDAAEVASLVPGVQTIALELAARFCVDAFEDRYFGWDATRFPSRREHNRVRARGQLALARAVAAARSRAEAIVASAFR